MSFVTQGLFRAFAATPQGSRLLGRIADAELVAASRLNELSSVREELSSTQKTLAEVSAQLDTAQNKLASAHDAIVETQQGRDRSTTLSEQEKDREIAALRADYAHIKNLHAISADKFPFVENGHFYSPIPSLNEIERDWSRIFPDVPRLPIGIDMRESEQLELLRIFGELQSDMPFEDEPNQGRRYGFVNPAYSYSDALFLNGMLRHFRPKRFIEVGSGYSSCMTLDTRDIWLGGDMQCTFIEPYPELLMSLLKPEDFQKITVIPTRVQDVDLGLFRDLHAGDVLFIDSTHVTKTGSDVNFLFLEVLPCLAAGVLIHVHDVFYPFEYPGSWLLDGRAWNEQYLLRALLQQGGGYEILAMNSFLFTDHLPELRQHLPLALKNSGGSIWFRKLAPAWTAVDR